MRHGPGPFFCTPYGCHVKRNWFRFRFSYPWHKSPSKGYRRLQSDDDIVRVNTRSSRMQHVLHIGAQGYKWPRRPAVEKLGLIFRSLHRDSAAGNFVEQVLARCNTAVDVSSPDGKPNYICRSRIERTLVLHAESDLAIGQRRGLSIGLRDVQEQLGAALGCLAANLLLEAQVCAVSSMTSQGRITR